MSKPLGPPPPGQLEPYTALAPVFQAAGLAEYSLRIASQIMNLAFDLEWTGRTLLDMGCGTGDMVAWFTDKGMRVLGIDISPNMIQQAQATGERTGIGGEYRVGDLRGFHSTTPLDLVVSVGGVMNYMPTLRDLEQAFRVAYHVVDTDKLFIFDMRTIQGLAADGSRADVVISDKADDHLILVRNSFNYETLALTTQYVIYTYRENTWSRAEELHQLRGYPLQAVTRMLTHIGFKVLRTLTTDLEHAESRRDVDQVIIVAQKVSQSQA